MFGIFRHIALEGPLQNRQNLSGHFGLLEYLESDRARNRINWSKAVIENIEIPGDAVVEPMNPVTQLKGVNLAAPPPGKLRLEIGKLGSKLTQVGRPQPCQLLCTTL